MAIKAPSTSTRPALYKMVSLPSYGTATGVKGSADTKVVQSSYKAFITSINRIGATINSTIIVNQQILKTLTEDTKLKAEELAKMKSAFQKEKAGKDIDGTDEGAKKEPWWKKAMSGFAKAVVPNFFEGLAQLGQFFLRTFVLQGVLRWMSDPKNGEKLAKIVGGLIKIFSWLYKFVTENLFKTIEGLVDMFDGDKNIWERIVGFGKFITGFGALLIGMTFLKKPTLVIRGFIWVLTTLYKNLFKAKGKLSKQATSGSIPGGGGAGRGGRGRGLATFAAGAATGALLGGMMGGGDSAPEPSDASAPKEPLLAAGGIATKPTSAILGERGPEITMPLSKGMPIPADNEKRRRDAGIKPLSSLGSMGGTSDPKQANNLSKLFMAPFKGIGAGILANISQVVSSIGGPTGKLLTPILGNLIAPIANSFGIPPGIVKTVQGKMLSSSTAPAGAVGKDKGSEQVKKLFGKAGSLPSEEEKKFKKRSDTSVLGLLSDILGASIVINNKLRKSGGDTTTTSSTGDTASSESSSGGEQAKTPGASGGGAAGGATNTAQETIKKAGGMREDGTLKGVQGTTRDMGRAGKEHSPGAGLMPVENGNRKYWYNNSGDVFMWEKPGDPLTDLTSAGDKSMISSKVLGGPMVRDLKDGKVKILKGLFGGDQTPVGYYSYEMGAILKKRGNSGQGRSKTGATKDEWLKPTDGKYGPTITPKTEPPKKAKGGWITGPMSGYPVSLDGGNSIAFEGHGTEWVGFKKAAGGSVNSAFVVPFDTPATRSNGGLVSTRLAEAKRGGYSLPSFARGGKVKEPKGSGDEGLKTATSGGAVITSKYGPRWGRWHAGVDLAGVPVGTPITSKTGGKVLYASSYSGYGNTVDLQVSSGKVLRFAHLDGFLVKKGDVIAPGTKIGTLGNTGIGTGPHLHFEHRSKADFGKGTSVDPIKSGALGDITIGGKPIQGAKPGQSSTDKEGDVKLDSSTETEEAEKTPEEQFQAIIAKMTEDILKLSGVPAEGNVAKATEDAKTQKEKAEKAADQRLNNAATAAMKNAKNAKPVDVKKAFSAQPIILPGPRTTLPIEALNPSTSMIQYGWKVNL